MSQPDTSQTEHRSRSKTKLKYKAGKVTRNPFLNFLRDFRKRNKKGLKLTELTKEAARVWRSMSARDKSPYCSMAKQAPRRVRRRSSRPRRKTKRFARRNKGSRSRMVARTTNQKPNRSSSCSCPKDDIAVVSSVTSSTPKIVELPPDYNEDIGHTIEVIDLT